MRISMLLAVLAMALLTGCATTPRAPGMVQTPPSDHYAEEQFLNRDGQRLFARTWHPAGEARGNIILLHGTALHSGLYAPVAEQFSAAGYRVFAYDMRSWGRSGGAGANGYVESFDDYAQDLFLVVNKLRLRYPGTPNYLLGESLGGTVALYSTPRYDLWIDGIITSAAGYKPNPELLGIRAPGLINDLNMTVATWLGNGLPGLPILSTGLGIRLVVEDDALQQRLLEDPDVAHDWLPAAYAATLLEASDYIEDHLPELTVPVFVMHGERDMLVPVASSEEILQRVSSSEKGIRRYDSAHTLLLEVHRKKAARDAIDFLDRLRVPGGIAQHDATP